jgi:hypothetical protein
MNRLVECPNLRRCASWCALALLAAPGCAAPLMTSYLSGSRQVEKDADVTATDAIVDDTDPKAIALRKATGQEPATADEALAGVLEELEEIRAIDPAAHAEVMANLKTAKPADYPLIVKPFRAALAYKQQLVEREREAELQMASDNGATSDGVQPSTFRPNRLANRGIVREPSATPSAGSSTTAVAAPTAMLPPPPTALADRSQHALLAAKALGGQVDAQLRQASATMAARAGQITPEQWSSGDWQSELDAAIADLERTLPEHPATVDEMHEYFRLRALQLVAGREEEAYAPIPGASPAQQEYWSKQLFAMASYMNRATNMDEKHRAAAALVHLDEARTSLAELATLQVRHLTFVDHVAGFGVYEPQRVTKFEPGAEVKLYAEVENFACTSTGEGFETRLATSYRVIDSGGRQVEASPFPEVVDVCQSRRRDFHLKYGFALPTRISPGEYQVELTITDQHSGKIGHASVPFEINAGR